MRPSWNLQLVRIGDRGMKAFEEGKKREDCPYKWSGRSGFNAQRRAAWLEGFELAVTIASDQRLFDQARANSSGAPAPAQ